MISVRRSLLTRLLIVSTLVAVCSIAATAWLAARTVTRALQQEEGDALAKDGSIYRGLLSYASTHPSWTAVEPVVDALSESTGRQITLVAQDGTHLAGPLKRTLPAKPSVIVDPLAVDLAFVPDASKGQISSEAIGPFRLAPAEQNSLHAAAIGLLTCLRDHGGSGTTETDANGRARVETANPAIRRICTADVTDVDDRTTVTETRGLSDLQFLVNTCLVDQHVAPVWLQLDFTWSRTVERPASDDLPVPGCIATARRQQLGPYVAPAALLYISGSNAGTARFDLSTGNQLRIIVIVLAILVLVVGTTIIVGMRMVRPLRNLTQAAQTMASGYTGVRVRISGNDEITRLGTAFNEMSAERERMELQRRTIAADIAHELRSPLTNIRGWLEATRDGIGQHDEARNASLLEESILLQQIVDDLQDLAMADAGRLELHKTEVDVAVLLAQVQTALATSADAAGITLEVQVPSGLHLFADPTRLRQALQNLAANSLRHTPPGGIISMKAAVDADAVVLDVTDTGSGIAPEDLAHVFDRFWRAEKSRNRSSGGSGLGLAIVRRLVESHGGSVDAQSTVGHGSTFTIRLPALTGSMTEHQGRQRA
ncbi:MAG: histidine kinase [Ilumatobacteraceae bacterium]|nr:histidine kinase [Ilumatobacteraceae bacterium]